MHGGTLDLNGYNETIGSLYSYGGAIVTNNASGTSAMLTVGGGDFYSAIQNGAGSGGGIVGLTITGNFWLNGTTSYTGGTTIDAGTVYLVASCSLGSSALIINGGTLDLNGNNATIASLAGSGGIVTNSALGSTATLTVGGNNASTNFYGTLESGSGTLDVNKVGTGTLSVTSDSYANFDIEDGSIGIL